MSEIREQPYKLLLHGHDTVECCYYLRALAGQRIDFEQPAIQREVLHQAKSKDP